MADTKIRVSMILDSKDFVEGMNAAGVSVEDLAKKTDTANEKTGTFSAWLAGGVAGLVSSLTTKLMELGQAFISGVADGAKAAVEAFTGFERSMRNVNSIAQESDEQFKKTSQAVLDLSIELGKSPTGLSEALFDINSAGVTGSKALDMVKDSARLAEAGLTDTKTAAGALLTAMQLYGEEVGTTANAADKFSKANEIGRTTIGELSKEFGRVATTAKTAGVSFNETMAAMAALTLAGQETNLAATNLNAAFTEIIKPSNQLAESFQKQTGSTVQAYTAQNGMVGTLKALYEITGGSTEQLGKLGLSQSALSAIAGLASNNFKTFDDAIKSVSNSSGTLEKQLDQQQVTLAKAIEKWNALKEVILIQIGEKLAPVLGQLIDIAMEMGKAVQAWLSNADNVKKLNELVDAARIAVSVMVEGLKGLALTFTEAFKTGSEGADKAGTAIDTLIGLFKLLAIGVNVVLSYLKPVVEILGDMGRMLGALSENKWGEAMKASMELVKDSVFALPKATMEAGKAMMDSGEEYKKFAEKMEADKLANAQRSAEARVKAEAEAQKAMADAVNNGTASHAKAMETQVAAQKDASKAQGQSVSAMVEKAHVDYNSLTEKDRNVKIKTDVNGIEQLEVFDKLKDGKLNLAMDWANLEAVLKATVHQDNLTIIAGLQSIDKGIQKVADKIPQAASSF